MKRIIINILAGFGVVFICLIIAVAYFIITDPYNLKPLFFPQAVDTTKSAKSVEQQALKAEEGNVIETTSSETINTSDSDQATLVETVPARVEFNLSTEQRQALLNLGVPETSVPNSVSYEQEQCFISVLGKVRVEEIKTGAVPSTLELIRAKACI